MKECRKLKPTRPRDEPTWNLPVTGPDHAYPMRSNQEMLQKGLATGTVRGTDCAYSMRGDHTMSTDWNAWVLGGYPRLPP